MTNTTPAPRPAGWQVALWTGPLGGTHPATDRDAAEAALRILFPDAGADAPTIDEYMGYGTWIVDIDLPESVLRTGWTMARVGDDGIAARIEVEPAY